MKRSFGGDDFGGDEPPGTDGLPLAKRTLDGNSAAHGSGALVFDRGGAYGSTVLPPLPAEPNGMGIATGALIGEITMLKSEITALEAQLAQLQENHARLTVEHAGLSIALPKSRPPHDPSWEVHTNPANGMRYYFNKRTSASMYEKPADYNPRPKADASKNVKGPPGANLFVVRKMRKGDLDDFDDADLREAFSKYGEVRRCELAIDPATNWSKGYGFVSMSTPEEANLAIQMLHGRILAGKEMKVELTKEDGR